MTNDRAATTDRPRPEPPAGFTLIELLIVVLIIGVLAAVAIPNMQSALLRARAAEAVGDLQAIRVATLNYLVDRGEWPEDDRVGNVPPGLEDYLPNGFTFERERYRLNYDNWSSHSPRFIAVTVETGDDPEFGDMVLAMLGSNAWSDGNFKFTWVIEWLD